MKTSHAALLVVLAVIAGGILFLRLHNPEAFDRLLSGHFSAPPLPPAPVPPKSKPALPAQLAAPAVKAINGANARADEVMRAADNPPASPPRLPATPSPPAANAAPVSTGVPLSPAPASVASIPSIMNSPSDVINSPAESAAPAPSLPPPSPADSATPIMSAAPPSTPPATAATWSPPSPTPAHPNWTWTTTNGQVYKNVKVIKMDPQSVTILHQDGGANVPMETLPPDLQKLFNYDSAAAAQWGVGRLVAGNLVALRNNAIQPVADAALRPVRYIAVYYSAAWCPPCHTFTPELVKFYNGFKSIHSNFELIFVSEDRDPLAMAAYMREMNMPWLAVSYGALVHPPGRFKGSGIESFAGDAIPDLVLLDATGRVLSDTYRDGKYVGPEAVMNDIPSMVQ